MAYWRGCIRGCVERELEGGASFIHSFVHSFISCIHLVTSVLLGENVTVVRPYFSAQTLQQLRVRRRVREGGEEGV